MHSLAYQNLGYLPWYAHFFSKVVTILGVGSFPFKITYVIPADFNPDEVTDHICENNTKGFFYYLYVSEQFPRDI